MTTLKSIMESLQREADEQLRRAYNILGAKPGPGHDLLIYPVQPICGKWHVTGLTKAGVGFVGKFWSAQPFVNINQLKREAYDWGLKYRIEYPVTALENDDGIIRGRSDASHREIGQDDKGGAE